MTSNVRRRIPISLGQATEQCLRRDAVDVTRFVSVIARYWRVSRPATLYSVDDDANQDEEEECPQSSTEGDEYGNAFRVSMTCTQVSRETNKKMWEQNQLTSTSKTICL